MTSYLGASAVPAVAYSLGLSRPVTEASPCAPPSSGMVVMSVPRSGSMKATPSLVATATRLTVPTEMPGSLPMAMAASRALRVSPDAGGSSRMIVVPGDAASSCAW